MNHKHSLLQFRIAQYIFTGDILAEPFEEIFARLIVQHPLVVVIETQGFQQGKILNEIEKKSAFLHKNQKWKIFFIL
jgi:hypothetical protein